MPSRSLAPASLVSEQATVSYSQCTSAVDSPSVLSTGGGLGKGEGGGGDKEGCV